MALHTFKISSNVVLLSKECDEGIVSFYFTQAEFIEENLLIQIEYAQQLSEQVQQLIEESESILFLNKTKLAFLFKSIYLKYFKHIFGFLPSLKKALLLNIAFSSFLTCDPACKNFRYGKGKPKSKRVQFSFYRQNLRACL